VDSSWLSVFSEGALWKLLLALLLGGLVGLEREWHGRAAGLRTHVLVCLGATILLIAARSASELFSDTSSLERLVLDPNRISAGIVTGIGFLGAGAILRTGDLIRGLTTAGCIWFVAALGIVIGNGLYGLAVISTLLVLLVLIVFDILEHAIPPVVYRSLSVAIAVEEHEEFERWCRQRVSAAGMQIQETLLRIDSTQGRAELVFRVRVRGSMRAGRLIEEISQRPGIRQVRWDQALGGQR
jgi:putative Mg2+ transporter-C (MgtC) family protein